MARPAELYDLNSHVTGEENYNSTCLSCDFDGHAEADKIRLRRHHIKPAAIVGLNPGTRWKTPTNYRSEFYTCNVHPMGDRIAIRDDLCPPGYPCPIRVVIDSNGYGIDGAVSDLPDVPSWMGEKAITRAFNKLKQQKVNLGVAFAERHETAELCSKAMERIAAGVRAWRRRHSKSLWNQVKQEGQRFSHGGWKNIPNSWLELQYGWNPLMEDVEGACKKLAKRERDPDAYSAQVYATVKDNYVRNWSKSVSSIVVEDFPIKDTVVMTCKVGLRYNLDNPLLATFSSLGVTNPAEIVWERVRYSFVVDWFLPVGNWLSSLDADFGWKFKSGFRADFTKVTGRGGTKTAHEPNSHWRFIDSTEDFHFDGVILRRVGYDISPGVGLPHFKNPFSSHHIANALSLLTQAFQH